jgi:hypothetical protein
MLAVGNSNHRTTLDRIGAAVDDYLEECTHEGCSSEEVKELYSSYSEECLHEGCSAEELLELGGSPAGVEDMLDEFKKRGWKVDNDDHLTCDTMTLAKVSTDPPTQPGTMNCKVVFFLITKCKGLGADGHRYSWTEYGFGGVHNASTQCH